jgi:DNA-binding transcriptional ArsR family regulator
MVNYSAGQLDSVFSALSHSTRRAIVLRLAQGSANVTELAEPFQISLPAVSKHLKVLEESQLISRTKHGREYQMTLNPEALAEAQQWLEFHKTFWNRQFDSLERYLAEQTDNSEGD